MLCSRSYALQCLSDMDEIGTITWDHATSAPHVIGVRPLLPSGGGHLLLQLDEKAGRERNVPED